MATVLIIAVYILFAHFVADFVFQTDWMATNKSSSLLALNIHVAVYALILFVFVSVLFYGLSLDNFLRQAALYVMINAGAHIITDYCTSKLTSKLWAAGKRHEFFVVIGLDQFLHAAVLLLSLCYV